jgi:copper chaperone
MVKAEFKIEGMHCQHCVMAVQKALGALRGVTDSRVEIGSADVTYNEAEVTPAAIEEAITRAGYKVVKKG